MKSFIRSSLPTQAYLDYVSRLLQPGPRLPFDPFAIDLRNYAHEEQGSYVHRTEVHDNLPGSRVIVGSEGAGKSKVFRYLNSMLPENPGTLYVNLPLAGIALRDWAEEWMQGKVSCLTLEILVSTIFEAYWKNFINNPSRRQAYIKAVCDQDQVWMRRLHWFYNHYKPTWLEVSDDPAFTDWLNQPLLYPLLRETLSPEETFRQLIALVTGETGASGQKSEKARASLPYARIEILIDDVERISEEAAARLIRDTQRLYNLRLGFKIFIPPAYQDRLDDLECARQGRIATYAMPDWARQELKEMLARRWLVFSPGEPESADLPDWSQSIRCLDTPARRVFIDTIVSSALRVYEKKDEEQDAPVHALKIARAFLFASYECDARLENPILIKKEEKKEKDRFILTVKDLQTIANSYWE